MLFVASHGHPAANCPLARPEGKSRIKSLFSDDNARKSGLKMTAAYVRCPKDTGAEHKGFFFVEADNAANLTKFFGAMTVDLRQVLPFNEVARTL